MLVSLQCACCWFTKGSLEVSCKRLNRVCLLEILVVKLKMADKTESTALLAWQNSQYVSPSQISINSVKPKEKELAISLGFWPSFAYVVGILFGSGMYISPSLVARETNNMAIALVVWIVSGIIPILGALCFCELACAIGKTGGE